MANTVFLFGAGASYGSDTLNTPPLGTELFDELQRFNPDAWGTITGDLATRFHSDFEYAMQSVEQHSIAPLQRAMAAYFFKFQPSQSSLYFELASRIVQSPTWSGAACTLNYERLLELSLLRAGIQPFIGKAPLGKANFELCMPHGCCHIFCDAVQATAGMVSFAALNIQTDGHVSIISDPKQHRQRILQDAVPPVMSYFEPAKRTTAGHSFIEGQRARWQELAKTASTLIIVGLKVRSHDNHIWDPIASTNARVVYCGGPSGATEYRTWSSTTRAGHSDCILQGHFRDEFAVICKEAGL